MEDKKEEEEKRAREERRLEMEKNQRLYVTLKRTLFGEGFNLPLILSDSVLETTVLLRLPH